MARTKVFISYSHQDHPWLEKLRAHLAVLERKELIHVWSDTQIQSGNAWEQEIEQAMGEAKVAVLLITTGFLSSKYIWDEAVPRIQQHQKQGMGILPLITKPCAWRLEEWLAEMQVCPREGRPLSTGNEVQVDLDLMAFAYDLAGRVQGNHSRLAAEERARAEQLLMAASVQPLLGTRVLIDMADSSQPSTSWVPQILANTIEGDLPQTWKGVYHPDSQFSLIISTLRNGKFEVTIPGFPLKFSAYPDLPELQAPLLGQHGVQVLQEYLHYSETEIARLQQSGTLYREDR